MLALRLAISLAKMQLSIFNAKHFLMQKKALFMGQINSTLGTKKAAVPNASTFHCKRKSTALFLKQK